MKYFQLQACTRTRNKFIPSLCHNGVTLVQKEEKRLAIDNYYDEILGTQQPCTGWLNFEFLGIPTKGLVTIRHLLLRERDLVHHS